MNNLYPIKNSWGPFLLQYKVDNSIISELLEMSNNIVLGPDTDNRSRLAGQIEKELKYNKEQQDRITTLLMPYFNSYVYELINDPTNAGHVLGKNISEIKMSIDSSWVNYQTKYEYNPLHNHSGDISFVLYLNIPDEMLQEKNITTQNNPGAITFRYGVPKSSGDNSLVSKLLEPVDSNIFKPYTGDMFIFPSWLMHDVASFKSDVTRISMSGNLRMEIQ